MDNINLLNVKDFETLSKQESKKIKLDIINRLDLIKIPVAYLPKVHADSYYFISYSHKDFREVYTDLLEFEDNDFSFWYDRGIPAGKSWKDVANKYIAPFECKGVIFYISENSLLSDAVYDEIMYVKKMNKPFICIHIPFSNDYQYQGESVKGKIYSVSQMLDIITANSGQISKEKAEALKEIFPDEHIYLPLAMDNQTKVEKIISNIPEQPLIDLDDDHKTVLSVNDINVSQIKADDFDFYKDDRDGAATVSFYLGDCAFANLRYLETITFPENNFFVPSGRYAFYNCINLKEINNFKLPGAVYDGMFCNCRSLEKVDTKYVRVIDVYLRAFKNCEKLTIDFEGAFSSLMSIQREAFYGCAKIRKFVGCKSIQKIGHHAFANCKNLETANLYKVNELGWGIFEGCSRLKEVVVDKTNEKYASIDGALYSKDLTMMIFYPHMKLSHMKLPKETTVLGSCSLAGIDSIISFKIPPQIETIGGNAFSHCNKLKEIYLPKKLTAINMFAFSECPNLEKIFYPGTKDQFFEKVNCMSYDFAYRDDKFQGVFCTDGQIPTQDLKRRF